MLHVAPASDGDVSVNSVGSSADTRSIDTRGAVAGAMSRSDTCRGPFDKGECTGLMLRTQPKASEPRTAIAFELAAPHPAHSSSSLSAMAVEEAPGCLVGAPDAATDDVTSRGAGTHLGGGADEPGRGSAGSAGASRERGVVVLSELPQPRCSLRLGDEWTLACWLHLPLPPRPEQQGQVRTLAMGLPPGAGAAAAAEAAEAAASQGSSLGAAGAVHAKPLSHVLLCELGGAQRTFDSAWRLATLTTQGRAASTCCRTSICTRSPTAGTRWWPSARTTARASTSTGATSAPSLRG